MTMNPINVTDMLPHDIASPTLAQQLEALIDRHGLVCVLNNLAFIADEKAQHLECNWQDKNSAKAWTRAAKRIRTVELWATTQHR